MKDRFFVVRRNEIAYSPMGRFTKIEFVVVIGDHIPDHYTYTAISEHPTATEAVKEAERLRVLERLKIV